MDRLTPEAIAELRAECRPVPGDGWPNCYVPVEVETLLALCSSAEACRSVVDDWAKRMPDEGPPPHYVNLCKAAISARADEARAHAIQAVSQTIGPTRRSSERLGRISVHNDDTKVVKW